MLVEDRAIIFAVVGLSSATCSTADLHVRHFAADDPADQRRLLDLRDVVPGQLVDLPGVGLGVGERDGRERRDVGRRDVRLVGLASKVETSAPFWSSRKESKVFSMNELGRRIVCGTPLAWISRSASALRSNMSIFASSGPPTPIDEEWTM